MGPDGLVLTNVHVVCDSKGLGAIFYRPDLVSDFPPPLDLSAEAKSKLKPRLLGNLFDVEKVAPPTEPMSGVLGFRQP